MIRFVPDCGDGRGLWFRFDEILDDERNPAVRRIQWIGLFSEPLIRKAAHLSYLVDANPIALHQAPRRITGIWEIGKAVLSLR